MDRVAVQPPLAPGISMVSEKHPMWKLRVRAAAHHVTWFLGQRFPDTFPFVFVVGYQKSGTTWMCQLVADYLQLPFPRHSLLPIGFEAVVHGHEPVRRSYRRGVYSVRDGRDAMVSAYFFLLRSVPDGDNPPMPPRLRRLFPGLRNKAEVRKNLVPFMEREFTRPRYGLHWGQHVRSYYDVRNPSVVMLRYEDLLDDGAPALASAMAAMTGSEPDLPRAAAALERYSFARQSKRKAGEEDRTRFLRKGQAGDWRNHFTREAAELFDRHAGDMLIQAGYERDRSWVSTVGVSPQDALSADEVVSVNAAGEPRQGAGV